MNKLKLDDGVTAALCVRKALKFHFSKDREQIETKREDDFLLLGPFSVPDNYSHQSAMKTIF